MNSPAISNHIINRAETFFIQGTTAISTATVKWLLKKDAIDPPKASFSHLVKRRNSIIQNYAVDDMIRSVETFGKGLDLTRFFYALEKFLQAQDEMNVVESEESLSARKIKMSNAHEELKREFNRLNLNQIKEKRVSDARQKILMQSLADKALKVKQALGQSREMLELERVIEEDPALAEILLNARLVLIKNSLH